MTTSRKRWRLILGIATVIAVIVAMQFIANSGIKAGLGFATFIFVIVLIITGIRKGGGGTQPQHYKSGATGNSGGGF